MSTSSTQGPSEAVVRARLQAMVDPAAMAVSLLLVGDHHDDSPAVYDVPMSTELADELLAQVAETATAAVDAELLPAHPGHTPSGQQWVHTAISDGPLSVVEPAVLTPSHRQYERDTEFGRRNLLVLRLTDLAGHALGRMYQGFSPEKTLSPSKRILAFWNGERFTSLDSRPLIIDRNLRLFVFDGLVVMKSNGAFESLFGPLPDLREQATSTFTATLGKLEIVGGDELRAACESDINMMRKLLSIQRKMDQPGYPEALDMPSVLAFLARNPHIDVPVDTSGDAPALVFQPQAQRRWALLKLLDDDFLRSDLTNINYEANSKSEVPSI
ncbi:hypothetical protein ABIB25_000771 [Nakamurella sp. UYEF19]|uniref:Kiwa anti-phage protein KwaB-like domain-containing protein n=1 Tax=Nakamurella sp. UYEF19 TaxID=1756392 RepID=UPI00339789E2